ncbi:MAG: hypothetical protein H7249_04550 [Chitinophagaceae bacterium]|nr:hypothetical protein [Oligoflexus sp.]
MKLLLPLALSLAVFAGCTHDKAPEAASASASEPSAKEGWNSMKSGAKETAHGTGEVAKDAGKTVVDGAKEAGHAIKEGAVDAGHAVKAAACPVLGNKLTKTYYTKTSKSYQALLNGKNALSYDNRECFSSEANAREAGFAGTTK